MFYSRKVLGFGLNPAPASGSVHVFLTGLELM